MTLSTRVMVIAIFALAPGQAWAQAAIVPVPGTTTRDIPFTSHDGYPMVGRLTLPDTPGPHPILMLVQTAEAATMDGELRNAKGVRVRIYNQYRELLAPMGIGFFSYEGRGVTSNAGGGPVIDRNGVQHEHARQQSSGRHFGRADAAETGATSIDRGLCCGRISEGTMLAAEIAVQIPKEVAGLVLSGVIGSTLKDALVFMASDGAYLAHLENWDINKDGRITAAEFETDSKGIRKLLPAGTPFGAFDRNGDGVYTRDELLTATKPLVEAIQKEHSTSSFRGSRPAPRCRSRGR